MSDGDLFGNNGTTNGSQANNAISHPIRSRSHSSQQMPCSNADLEYNYSNEVESGHASIADLVSSSSSVNPSLSPLPNKCKENLQESHVAVAASNYYTKNNYYCHTFGSGAPSHSSGSSDTHSSRRQSSNLCEASRGRYPDNLLVQQSSSVAVDGDCETDKNWLEEIQFKAQYKHFRSNNYSSVVNSANSLDKLRVDVDSSARISAPNVSQKGSQQRSTEEPLKDRHSLCWSFPRVKLGRIFNAKSLEDILGRNRKSQQFISQTQSPYQSPHQSQSTSCNTGKKRSRFRQQSQSNSSLVSSNKPLSTSPPHHLSTSSSENNCSFITRVATSHPDSIPGSEISSGISGSSSFAKSKLLVPVNTNSERGSGSNSKIISSIVSNTPGNISYIKKSSKISPRTTPNPQVSCAKSDNCLNRIVASAFCTNKLIRSSVDNIDTAISQQEPHSAKKKSLVLNVPLAQKNLKKSILEPAPVTNSKTGLCFGKKPNKINPDCEGIFPTSGNVTISDHINSSESQNNFLSTESSSRAPEGIVHLSTNPTVIMTKKKNVNSSAHKPFVVSKQKASSAMEKEKVQLVVANVSYLQRPVSPCRPNASPTFDLASASGLSNVNSSNNYCPQQHHYQNEPTCPYNIHSSEKQSSAACIRGVSNSNQANMPIPSYNYNTGVGSYASHLADVRNTNTNAKKVNTNFHPGYDSSNIKQSRLGFVSHHNNNITFPSSSNSIIGGGDYAVQAPGLSSAAVLDNNRARDALKRIELTSSTLPNVGPDGCSLLKPKNKSLPFVPNSLSYRDQNIDNNLDHQIRQEKQVNPCHWEPSASKLSGDQNSSSEETSWGGPSYYYQFQNLKVEEPNLCMSENSDNRTDGDTVMDLQSPQYVKRTAHMFNLRYTSQLNESSASGESPQRNPSYLNVSRSVCGYSCLSYNNGTSTTKTSNSSSGSTPKAPPFPPKVSSGIRSDLSIVFKTNSLNGKGEESRESSSSPPPPPLPKSMAPKYVSTINIENNSTISKENGKSFIMQKIERLYGSEAVSSTGLLLKRSSLSSDERIIPISVEGRSHDSNNKSQWKSQPQSKEQTLYSTRRFSSQTNQEDASNDSVEGTSVLSPVRNIIVSPNKIPVEDLNKCSDSLMFVVKKGKQESCVSNRNLHVKEPAHYENGHKAANDSGFGDKDLDAEVDIVNNEDANLVRRNGNLKDDVQCTGEPTGVSSALSLESSTSISPVGSTADDSGLGEGEERLPFSSKAKPKPKPKPKDMALRRTARNADKTAAIPSNKEDILIVGDDVTDSEAIKNSTLLSPEQIDPVLDTSTGKEVASLEAVESDTKTCTANKENEDVVVRNGNFFINEMEKVKSLIEERIFKATEELDLDDDPNSERAGRIRAAIGKANLLIKKKFKQFHELCQANLAEQEEKLDNKPFQTKNEDLAGFWDMVYIQVEEIFQMFKDLEKMSDDSSFTDQPDSATAAPAKTSGLPRKVGSQTTVKSVSKSSAPAKSSAAAARDESRRRLLAEKRRALKNQAAAPKASEEEAEVQFFVPDSTQRS